MFKFKIDLVLSGSTGVPLGVKSSESLFMVYSSSKCVVIKLDTNIQDRNLTVLFQFHGEFVVGMSAVEKI